MADEKSPQIYYLRTGEAVSTNFVFNTVDIQNQANSTYVFTSTLNGQAVASNAVRPNLVKFKSDRERMLYILGQQGVVPGCAGRGY